MPVEAYILIQTEAGELENVVNACKAVDGITKAEALNGPYDVIAFAQTAELDDLNRLVMRQVQQISGVTRTLTCPVMHF
jgi:DNA-binding Lrp family transcriptional regulator